MPNYTQGDTRPILQPADLATYQGNGSLVLDSRRTRPLWFDGRFLAARDFEREQNYFLLREADLARSPGFRTIDGLMVSIVSANGQSGNATAISIQAGRGITPAGEIVAVPNDLTVQLALIADDTNLDVQFGLSPAPVTPPGSRTGVYLIALKPVQFAANPITAYPTSIQGSTSSHDGDLVEATAIVLVPYPSPSNNATAAIIEPALARQIFVTGNSGSLPDSLLPLAMVSLQNGAIVWLDPWMVRRDTGVEFSGLHFGLTDPSTQQAFLLEYDTQLQAAVNSFVNQKLPARFAATDYFQSIPPAGRFPLGSVSTDGFTQLFFPPQMDVRLSIVPEDELPALIEDSMSLPPLDLTLEPAAFANITVFALVPVPRAGFAALASKLPAVQVTTILPQVLSKRRPLDLLQFYRGLSGIAAPSANDNSSWQTAFGTQTYGYYIRRRSSAPAVAFQPPPPPPVIRDLSPPSAVAGSPAFTLQINGQNFTNKMAVLWNSTALPAAFLNPASLQAQIAAALITAPGTASITAHDAVQSSNAAVFTITPPPSITAISKNAASTCDAGFTLTVTGANFSQATQVTWNGTALATLFVSPTKLNATVTPNLLLAPGTVSIGVTGMSPASPAIPLTVAASFVLRSVSPSPMPLNAGPLTLSGCGFTATTQVIWGQEPVLSTFVNANEMTATVPASLLQPGAVVSITLKNGNTVSNAVSLTIEKSQVKRPPTPVPPPKKPE